MRGCRKWRVLSLQRLFVRGLPDERKEILNFFEVVLMGIGRMTKRNRRREAAAKFQARDNIRQRNIFEKLGYDPKEYYVIYHRN